jgi:hypothetical protein
MKHWTEWQIMVLAFVIVGGAFGALLWPLFTGERPKPRIETGTIARMVVNDDRVMVLSAHCPRRAQVCYYTARDGFNKIIHPREFELKEER